ncbi:MAG: AMP-binding acetyl-CoA synthetase, partial [Rhodanobacter sp.]|nr:AMP-binding acetyl-CoA synthetase [Rhodanobacter sp.]
ELGADLERLMDRVNDTLEDHERLDFMVVVGQPWTIESGLLTPTLKIKRDAIEGRYLPHSEAWRAQQRKVIWEPQ